MRLGISTRPLILLIVGCLGSAGQAFGDLLTFYFSGHITFVHDFLDLDESVFVSAPFSGGYTFDPTGVTDGSPSNPTVGWYDFGSAGQIWAQIGNYEFFTNDLGILIWNDRVSGDLYQPISFSVFPTGGVQWSFMRLVLRDATRTALDSDALFTGVPDLSAFASSHLLALYLPGDDVGIAGEITSLTPEPDTLGLLALGALFFRCRRLR